jgi:two-component system, OmpR family, phosphate regulon sensor histidine kinase PhoR
MNRKKFAGLITMMLLSIFGIIWVQIVWIKNAITIRNESFNNAVYISLNNAANTIESARKLNFFNNFVLADPNTFNGPVQGSSNYLRINGFATDSGSKVSVKMSNQIPGANFSSGNVTIGGKSYSINGDTTIVTDNDTLIISGARSQGKLNMVKQGEEYDRDYKAMYVRQSEFLDWVKKRSSEFQNMSQQLISEIYQWEKTLELDNKEIEYSLRQYFSLAGIQTPFEFAVIKDGIVQAGSFKRSNKKDFLKSNYQVGLFPGNIIHQDLVLSVIFPARTNYVLGSIAALLGGSLLFSLFILATFGLSLYFIIRQKKISEIKSDFINNMTHEFKTPIATISLAADTITNPKIINNETSIRHFIGMIKKENDRMNKKVETILQIASLDKKEMEFRFEKVSLHTIIQHSVDTIDIQVQQRAGMVNLHLDATEHHVYGDIEHLTNLVNNLLDNAIKYSPESPEIKISTGNAENGIILSVEDKGIGMSKTVQSKIFERFYRQSSGDVHDVKGFGLGLNYARAIIEAHKGNITVFSEPGKGSRFDVFLPLNLGDTKDEQ